MKSIREYIHEGFYSNVGSSALSILNRIGSRRGFKFSVEEEKLTLTGSPLYRDEEKARVVFSQKEKEELYSFVLNNDMTDYMFSTKGVDFKNLKGLITIELCYKYKDNKHPSLLIWQRDTTENLLKLAGKNRSLIKDDLRPQSYYVHEGFYQNVGNPWKDWLDKVFPKNNQLLVADDGYHHKRNLAWSWKASRYDDISIIFKGIDFKESFILDIRKINNIFSITPGPITISIESYRNKEYYIKIHDGIRTYGDGTGKMISFWYDSKKQSAFDSKEWNF